MTAARYNTGKPELGYVLEFPTAIKAFARVKELGAVKYDRGNWRKGGKPDNEYLDACLRHLVSFVEGEYYADDSGCAHLAHAMWNIMALMELNYPGQIIDKEVFDKMMKEWAERKRVKAEEEPSDEAPNMIVSSGVPVVDTEFKQKLQKILPLARHAVANEIREKHKEAVESFLTDHNVVKSTDDYHLVDGKFMPTSEVADRVFEDEVYGGGHDTGFAD